MYIVMNLEVQNSFEQPQQAQLLAEEIADMSARIEDTTEFSEEDVFLSSAFDIGAEVMSENLDTCSKWLAGLSQDFPGLVFSVDLKDLDLPDDVMERWYFLDGRRQIAKPYMVVPDFDPDNVGEEIK